MLIKKLIYKLSHVGFEEDAYHLLQMSNRDSSKYIFKL
jgi:hypothetical protein